MDVFSSVGLRWNRFGSVLSLLESVAFLEEINGLLVDAGAYWMVLAFFDSVGLGRNRLFGLFFFLGGGGGVCWSLLVSVAFSVESYVLLIDSGEHWMFRFESVGLGWNLLWN